MKLPTRKARRGQPEPSQDHHRAEYVAEAHSLEGGLHLVQLDLLGDERVEVEPALPVEEGADVVVDAVGRPQTWKQAFYARDLAGTVVLVGVPTPEMKVPDLPLVDVFSRGGALKSSWYGDCLPSRDFPMLVDRSEAVSSRDKLCHQQRRSGLLRWQRGAARLKDETRPLERHAIASASAIWPSKPTSVARTR
jgi:threonine dehydrogenase-like Zn-dependent dehydrogenase